MKKLITLLCIIFLMVGCTNDKPKEEIDLSKKVEGIKASIILDANDKNHDFLKDIVFDENEVKVEVDTSSVDFGKEGTYEVIYTITSLKDETKFEKVKVSLTINQAKENDKEATKPNDKKEEAKKEEAKKEEKPTNSSSSTSSNPSSNTPSKPSTNTNSSKPSSKPSSSTSQSKPSSKPEHKHSWVDVTETIHHDAVYEQKWVVDQEAVKLPIYEKQQTGYICNNCKKFLGSNIDEVYNHTDNCLNKDGNPSGWTDYFEDVIVGYNEVPEQGHYENVKVKDAYDETIIKGQKCSCGATK